MTECSGVDGVVNRRAAMATLAAASLAGCANPFAVTTYRCRLKVVFEVDGQERAGESVSEVTWRNLSGAWGNNGTVFRSRKFAEAPVVDLGEPHGLVFALLAGIQWRDGEQFNLASTSVDAFRNGESLLGFRQHLTTEKRWAHIVSLNNRTEEASLSRAEYPIIVRFRDISDPQSVEEIVPERAAEILGNSVRLRDVSFKIVDEPPTEGILQILPWLANIGETLGGPLGSLPRPLSRQLSSSHFRQWPGGKI